MRYSFTFPISFALRWYSRQRACTRKMKPPPPSSLETLGYETDYSAVTNDEGPFTGGVFAREAGEPFVLPPNEPQDRPELLIDDNGNTNQLIVRLNLDDNDVTQLITGNLESFPSRGLAECLSFSK